MPYETQDIAVPGAEIESLIGREVDLLDQGDLATWMTLFTDDGIYWMPSHAGQSDPDKEISLFYEDRELMEIRAANFRHDLSPAMQHPVRSSHLVYVTGIEPGPESEPSWWVAAKFHAVLFHREEQTLFAGRYRYLIKQVNGRLQIKSKRVDLINVDAPLTSILIYI
jgi:benzoate/toluate 1,2-dioxygenase beta subunit